MTDAYRSFFKNFGSAYRTKHIRLQWANPALRIFGKGPKHIPAQHWHLPLGSIVHLTKDKVV
jgi:hypothetical protein